MLCSLLRHERWLSHMLTLFLILMAFGIPVSALPVWRSNAISVQTAAGCRTSEAARDLFDAIKHNDSRRVQSLLAAGADPNARATINWTSYEDDEASCVTALMYAARLGDAPTVRALLAARADVNARDNRGRLVWAYGIGDQTIRHVVTLLRESYEEVETELASRVHDEMNSRLQITEALLAAGANPNGIDKNEGSALKHAVDAGVLTSDARILKKLIAAGAVIKGKDVSILAYATAGRRIEAERAETRTGAKAPDASAVIDTLLAAGADVNGRFSGETALMIEAGAWRQEGVNRRLKVLLNASADVNLQDDSYGKTALLATLKIYQSYSYGERVNARNYAETLPDKVEVIKLLLASGADPNKSDKEGDSPLTASFNPHLFVDYATENEALLKALLAGGANPNVPDGKGRTLLALVSSERLADDYTTKADEARLHSLRILIDAGADVNVRNAEKQTPLALAIKTMMNGELIGNLIAAGADVNASDASGRTILMEAVQAGFHRIELVRSLLAAGAEVKARANDGTTALLLNLTNGALPELNSVLIEAGADVNSADVTGRTPLMAGINSSSGDMVLLLIKAKADVNARNRDGDNALMLAVGIGRDEKIIQALLAAGSDVNVVNSAGETALLIAAKRFGSRNSRSSLDGYYNQDRSSAVIEALLAAGANVRTQSQVGETALTIMAMKAGRGDLPIIRALIHAGQRNGQRSYPRSVDLVAAIRRAGGHSAADIVQELITAGVDVNAVDEKASPALIVAARDSGNAVVVRALLAAGTRVNAKDQSGDTALIAAVREHLRDGDEIIKMALHRDLEVIRALLSGGADVSVLDKDGQSALTLAEKSGNADLIGLLMPSRKVKAGVERAHPIRQRDADQVECHTSEREKDLFEAIKQKDSEKVKALLTAGVNPNAQSEINFEVWESTRKSCATALMQAALQGDLKTTEMLLAAKADVNASDSVGRFIWAYAIGYQNIKRIPAERREAEMNVRLQIAKALLVAGANPDSKDPAEYSDYWSETALFHAATAGSLTGDLRILNMMIAAGASVKDPVILPYVTRSAQREAWGDGPKAPGAAAVIKTLLAAGANVNGQNGMSSLMMEAYGWELEGTVERAKVLLAAGADVNGQDGRTGETALLIVLRRGQFFGEPTAKYQAAARSRLELIKLLLASGADPNQRDKQGNSPLPASFDTHWLAYYPNEYDVIFKALIAAGAKVDSRNKDGRTILALAAWGGACDNRCEARLQLVRTLLSLGADVNAQDAEKRTPLLLAIVGGYGGNPDLFNTLIAAGADVNLADKDGETPLMAATGYTIARGVTYGGSPSLVQLLLKAGAKVSAKNINGDTPLTLTVLVGREESISQILIAAGADVNVKNNAGDTALLVNVKADGYAKTIQGLLAAGADVNVTDRSGDTALIIAARLYGTRGAPGNFYTQAAVLPVINALIDGGAEVRTVGAHGDSALTIMVTYSGPSCQPIIQQLISIGQRKGLRGYPRVADLLAAIRRAAGHSSSDSVKELIAAGVDVNGVDESGRPALTVAASESGNAVVVRALLEQGARINAKDPSGDTALIAAVREYLPGGEEFIKNLLHRDPEVIRVLLAAGADPRALGKDGDTALGLAKKSGNQNVISLLEGVAARP